MFSTEIDKIGFCYSERNASERGNRPLWSRSSQAAGLHDRTAKSAEEVAATARALGAGVRNSVVFRARSASDVDGTRSFSPCLTFWYFWVKPKVRRKLNLCETAAPRGPKPPPAEARKHEWHDSHGPILTPKSALRIPPQDDKTAISKEE